MKFTAKLRKTNEDSESLRITIPIEIVEALALKEGDIEQFDIKLNKNEVQKDGDTTVRSNVD